MSTRDKDTVVGAGVGGVGGAWLTGGDAPGAGNSVNASAAPRYEPRGGEPQCEQAGRHRLWNRDEASDFAAVVCSETSGEDALSLGVGNMRQIRERSRLFVAQLRRKLGDPVLIETVRGAGFVIGR